jgi:hypothetical protein
MKNILASLLVLTLATGCFTARRNETVTHVREQYEGGKLTLREEWTDSHRAGGRGLFADPKATGIETIRSNQSSLGGGSTFRVGQIESSVSTNGISAAGNAIGNVVEGAVKGLK